MGVDAGDDGVDVGRDVGEYFLEVEVLVLSPPRLDFVAACFADDEVEVAVVGDDDVEEEGVGGDAEVGGGSAALYSLVRRTGRDSISRLQMMKVRAGLSSMTSKRLRRWTVDPLGTWWGATDMMLRVMETWRGVSQASGEVVGE